MADDRIEEKMYTESPNRCIVCETVVPSVLYTSQD